MKKKRRYHSGSLFRGHHHRYAHKKKKIPIKMLLGTFALAAAILGVAGVKVINDQNAKQVQAVNSYDMERGYREITYNGKTYSYNNQVKTILFAGLDTDEPLQTYKKYNFAPRADSISLIALDKKHRKMTVIGISRDTMTDVMVYSQSGKKVGKSKTHLGWAYTYGEGGEVSCENLRESVTTLFGDIPIHDYFILNRSSIEEVNDIVGGITVKVPNDDVKEKHPELTKGKTVTLDRTNVYDYLVSRDTVNAFGNEGRMERQNTYIQSFFDYMKSEITNDPDEFWYMQEEMTDHLQMSITKSQYLDYMNALEKVSYDEKDFVSVPGENALGEAHDEFHIDETGLQELILNVFYEVE